LGVRPPRVPTVFEAMVNAVACQQLSLTVGVHLLDRLASAYGPTMPGRSTMPGFASPEHLAGAEPSHLRRLGFSLAKVRILLTITRRARSGALDLEGLERFDDERAFAALVGLLGIGLIPEQLRQRHNVGFQAAMARGWTRYGDDLLAVPAHHADEGTDGLGRVQRGAARAWGRFGGHVAAIMRDVTDRRAREHELRRRIEALERTRPGP
jgi:hypothetical protein